MVSREQEKVIDLIREKGPCIGLEIKKEIDIDGLTLWKECRRCEKLDIRSLGNRYLRLDRHVEGYARLSPSILREFLTYTVIGLTGDPGPLERRCLEVRDRIREISAFKSELARRMVDEVISDFGENPFEGHPVCFILAGDIVYNMAHDVPRPEKSTGRLVRGSDIDLVVVVGDDFPESGIKALDENIYQKKYRMLINPAVNEEVDYKIKRIGLVRTQAGDVNEFKHMVAVKILQEGLLLYGSQDLFRSVKNIIENNGLVEKLKELEERARIFREGVEEAILDGSLDEGQINELHLFYSAEEFEEFE
ncbi:MAG: hypothetical protein H6Q52_1771 [Deltaproteobacteria bacterium]|nr:hypothetical protein [Deltaproteobacteria bacterium]